MSDDERFWLQMGMGTASTLVVLYYIFLMCRILKRRIDAVFGGILYKIFPKYFFESNFDKFPNRKSLFGHNFGISED